MAWASKPANLAGIDAPPTGSRRHSRFGNLRYERASSVRSVAVPQDVPCPCCRGPSFLSERFPRHIVQPQVTFRFLLFLLLGLLDIRLHAAALPPRTSDLLFDRPRVLKIELAIAPEQVAALRAKPKDDVVANLVENGQTYTNVDVHLKGLGSFRPIDQKPSFAIKFNEHVPGVRFHGQTRILLENSSQDATYLRRKLTAELAVQAGLPAARVTYATVELNGRKLGLYTLSEAMAKSFLARNFGSSAGNLYEGSNADINGKLELDSGAEPDGAKNLQALIAACAEPDLSRRFDRLASELDLPRFISFMAFEVLITHHDGYSVDLNNFRLYHDPSVRRFVFIPHGMDLVFDRPTVPLEPTWKGIAAKAVMETTEGRKQYRERAAELAKAIYGGETLLNRVNELVKFLQPTIAELPEAERKKFDAALATLQENIRQRSRFVLRDTSN